MTVNNTSITKEQALEQLRATRAAGQYIDWDHEKNAPDIEGANGIELEGQISWKDMIALLRLAGRL
jgi:hypothetical protein